MKASITRARQILLFSGDVLALCVGLFLALAIRYGWPVPQNQLDIHKLPFAILFILWLLVFFSGGLYNLRNLKNNRSFFTLFFTLFLINAGIAVFFFYFLPFFTISPRVVMFLDLAITAVLLILWRIIFNRFVSSSPLRLAIVGSGSEVLELIEDLAKHPQQGYECVLHLTHPNEDLAKIIRSKNIDVVAVAVDYRSSAELQNMLFECIPLHIQFYDFVDFYEQYFQKIPLATIDRAWFLENLNESGKQYFSLVKRAVDIFMTILLGVVGVVLMPFIAIAILIDSGRPVFYSQMRVSLFEKPFKIYKFRSMKKDKEEVTAVGKFLRATHLDEIPQLWNILRGDMSFVGPRPEQVQMVKEFKEKIPFYTERLLVRSGITGWAQLHEPRAKAEDALQKLQYDLFYIKHRSFLLDIEIISKTLLILLS